MAKLRMGMIGGGPGSFIGAVHRIAAELDGQIELVAGAFSSDPERSVEAGRMYGIEPGRAYNHWDEMFAAERRREDGIQFAAIVTPNYLHLPIGLAAIRAGLPVMSDKPMTATREQAIELAATLSGVETPYRLSYTYSGYPLVREARTLVREGRIGLVRKVVVEYSQGWLAEAIERDGSRQAAWRTDPALAGEGGCVADIGVHAFHLAEFVTGLRVDRLSADLSSIVPGRRLDDDCNVLLRFDNGAPGVLVASQIAVGDRNGLRLRVYGEVGALDWCQERPNELCLRRSEVSQTLHAGTTDLGPAARAATRLPPGHPEGYLEAFANLYRDFADLLRGDGDADLVPGVADGLRGMEFVRAAVASSGSENVWVRLPRGEAA